MKIVLLAIIFVFFVISSDARRQKRMPGFSWEDFRPGRVFRPWGRRFNLGFFNNRRRWFDSDFDFNFEPQRPWYEEPWRRRINLGLFNNRRRWFESQRPWYRPWYEGPHVCTHKSVIKNETTTDENEITSHRLIKSVVCDDKGSSYKCTNSLTLNGREEVVVETRECCRGYTRKESHFGCPRVLEMKDLIDSAKDLNLTKFLEAVNISGFSNDIKKGNTTIFAPEDSAFENMPEIMTPDSELRLQARGVLMVSQPLVDTMVSDLKAVLLGHVSPEVYTSGGLNDEQLIDTASPYKNKIRINFYDKDLMTANCAKVTSRDSVATNGVIHVVDKMLEPVSKTLLDIISANPEMSYLKTAIGKSGLGKSLREDGQFTLLAPSDSAFRKLDPVLLSRILDGDKDCIIKLLQNHLLPNVICSAAIKGKTKSRNALDKYINLTRDADDKIFVNGAQAVDTDVMATNGVMYIIDNVLVPDEALDVLEIAKKSGVSTFANLIANTGLAKTLQTSENLTLFAPTDEALGGMENMTTNPSELMELLTYHVVPSKLRTCNMYNGQLIDTMNSEKKIRFNEFAFAFPFGREHWGWVQTVQCANIQKKEIQACNGVVYVIDKVLTPPRGKVLDVLASDGRFSELVQLIKIADIGDMIEENGPFTLFAPTNDAFELIDNKKLEKIVNDKDQLKKLLLNHIYKDQLCCSGLKVMARDIMFSTRRLKMLSRNSFRISTGISNDNIQIGKSAIGECDVMAANGVIHIIDEVLLGWQSDSWLWSW